MILSISDLDLSLNKKKEKILDRTVVQNEAFYHVLEERSENVQDGSSLLYSSRGIISDGVIMKDVSNFLIMSILTMSRDLKTQVVR